MNMKKLLFALSFCCSVIGFAQVGVGTATPDASAQLDVKSGDKGILIPRLDIADLNTAAPVAAGNIKESYGETQLVNHCSNGVQCPDEVHEQNRRSEFIITKR